MEKKTIGKFISALRKADGMTQRELGEKLFVSDKTVSRWERDECTPDLSLIPSIAEIFAVTTDELLRGERNKQQSPSSQETANKQKAKSDKQFKLMLYKRKKKYINLSFISIGLVIVGLIAAMICNLGFAKGLLGFCLASVFFVAATICQICFTVSFRLLIDEEEAEHAEEIKKVNTLMVLSSVKIFFGIFLVLAFCLPIAIMPPSQSGLTFNSWLLWGALFATAAFLIAFCVYKMFVLKALISKEIVCLDDETVAKANADGKLLKKLCVLFAVTLAVILLATYIVTTNVSETAFVKRKKFDNPDEFIEYMQSEYDAWYEEGYGDSPPHLDGAATHTKKWGEIDGKNYYFCAHLYKSIIISEQENGEWTILVTTEEDFQNGTTMYNLLNIVLLSLHLVNLLVCVIWYLVDTQKRKLTQCVSQ